MNGKVGRTDILVCELVRKADSLRLVLDGATVHNSVLELVLDGSVNSITLLLISAAESSGTRRCLHTKSSTVHPEARSTTGAV